MAIGVAGVWPLAGVDVAVAALAGGPPAPAPGAGAAPGVAVAVAVAALAGGRSPPAPGAGAAPGVAFAVSAWLRPPPPVAVAVASPGGAAPNAAGTSNARRKTWSSMVAERSVLSSLWFCPARGGRVRQQVAAAGGAGRGAGRSLSHGC